MQKAIPQGYNLLGIYKSVIPDNHFGWLSARQRFDKLQYWPLIVTLLRVHFERYYLFQIDRSIWYEVTFFTVFTGCTTLITTRIEWNSTRNMRNENAIGLLQTRKWKRNEKGYFGVLAATYGFVQLCFFITSRISSQGHRIGVVFKSVNMTSHDEFWGERTNKCLTREVREQTTIIWDVSY